MNPEYRKFDEPADVYIPPATAPEHFSNLPDVLIPPDYVEPERDPLEKEVAELIRDTKTPPPTPPELEQGVAGCRIFREVQHYVAPIYHDPTYQRMFTVKLIIGNMCTYIPTLIVLLCLMSIDKFDYVILNDWRGILVVLILSFVGVFAFIYFVGIFRNPPIVYIAVVLRTILHTVVMSCGTLMIHACFLIIIEHPENEEDERKLTGARNLESTDIMTVTRLEHAPPYVAVLIVLLMSFVKGVICVLLLKYKYTILDHKIPFVIYTTCHSTGALLVTIVLNNGFQTKPPSYDLFQVIFGCFLTSFLLMRMPDFFTRLFEGNVCPLTEGELLYALINFGL